MGRPAVEVGTLRIHKRSKRRPAVVQVKTASGWKSAARHSWTINYGPIPPGHRLDYIDGNSQNVELSNLQIIPIGKAFQRTSQKRPDRFAIGAANSKKKLAQINAERSFFHRRFRFLKGHWYPVVITEGLVLIDPHPTRTALELAYGIGENSLISPAIGKRFVDGDLVGYRRVTSLAHLLEKAKSGAVNEVDDSDE